MLGLLSATDVEAALEQELAMPRRLLPATSHYLALIPHTSDAATWIAGVLSDGTQPALEQVVAASKARHGVRPVAVWDLQSSVAYRALTNRLGTQLEMQTRSGGAWTAFNKAPVEKGGRYVVSADIASCYQMIDHGLLAEELIVQSGDADTVGRLIGLLEAVQGRKYGLPQQSVASDLLAEIYLASLERRVLRKSVDVIRYNDDFRINCDTWSEVVRAIEVLSEEARSLGLVLNDSKVLTYKAKTYAERLDHAELLRVEIAEDAALDLTFMLATYDDIQIVDPERADVEHLAAVRVLERWKSVAGRGSIADGRRAEHAALLQLVPLALRELSKSRDDAPGAIGICMQLLRFEQTMTPAVCEFLLSRNDEDALLSSFDKLLKDDVYLTGWQAWWIQQPLARTTFATGTGSMRRRNWLKAQFEDARRSPILRANAAKTLARHKLVSADDLLRVYDRSSPIERPIIVEAIALLKPTKNVRDAVIGDSKLHDWVFDWAAELA